MTGYICPMSKKERLELSRGCNWKYVESMRSKWEPFDFEESSIDMGMSCEPRFVINGVLYSPYKQYFIKEGSTTIRLIVAIESDTSEQGEKIG